MDYGLSKTIPDTDSRQEVWSQQREERGFDDTECWNLDSTFSSFIYPRLKRFSEMRQGYPGSFDNREEWDVVMEKMLFAFEFLSSDAKYTTFEQETWDRVDEGLQLFAKHYGNLWN